MGGLKPGVNAVIGLTLNSLTRTKDEPVPRLSLQLEMYLISFKYCAVVHSWQVSSHSESIGKVPLCSP